MESISRDMDQTSARRIAAELTRSSGATHIAVTVPLGCWGGTERAWAVLGPAASHVDASRFTSELDEESA